MKNLICAVTVLAVSTAQADTIYVDVNCPGPGNGSEAEPYCSIQTAIDNAVDTDEIVVAPGTYFEAIDFLGRAVWLHSSDGAEVTTIDAQQAGSVVTCDSGEGPDTVLEGFTVTGGTGTEVEQGKKGFVLFLGGGMYNLNSSPTVNNCEFGGNSANLGGGMYNSGSSPTVTGCAFIANLVFGSARGGGMYNSGSSPTVTGCAFTENMAVGFAPRGGGVNTESGTPTIEQCTFTSNHSDLFGGGVFQIGASAVVRDCVFTGNTAISQGGGLYSNSNDPNFVERCVFTANDAEQGGGLHNVSDGLMSVVACRFLENTADEGAGMYGQVTSLMLFGCEFLNNSATGGGGGLFNWRAVGDALLVGCLFVGNSGLAGGAVSNFQSSPMLVNCTITENTADVGGGMYTKQGSGPTVTNCILWGDSPDEIVDEFGGITTVRYSDVGGGYPGTGNIDADPLFVDPDNGDYRLSPGSPCIDAGDNTAVPKFVLRDLDGNPRFVADVCAGAGGATVDMGAYEFQGTSCDLSDTLALLAAWGSCRDCGTCPADFDGDCSVGILDLLILLGNWG